MRKSCLLVALVLVLMIRSSLCMTKCKKHELEALLKFKHSFTQDPLRLLASWVGEDCCHWRGVSCDDVSGNVVKLNLRNQQGYHNYLTSLVSSELSSALLELKFLTHLDLSSNDFQGSRIPELIGSMTKLRYLNFSGASFSGPIPPQIGNLTNLIHLDLRDNDRVYTEERFEWASSLSKLQSLDMSMIYMSQAYDALQVLFRLPSLLALSLSSCSLQNTHSSERLITNISSLQHLDLGFNYFEGIPSFLKNMPFLQSLSLEGNSLISGEVPIWLGNMTHLHFLDLSRNMLNGPVPTSIANLSALGHLDLSSNRLTGLIPDVLGHLTELEYLDISLNSIHGTVSHIHIGNLSKLSTLNMNFNSIKLKLSTNWRPPFQLQVLNVQYCEMNIEFPEWLRNQTQITDLDLYLIPVSQENCPNG